MLFPLIFLSSRSFFPLSLSSTSRSLPSLSRCFSSSPSRCLSFSPSLLSLLSLISVYDSFSMLGYSCPQCHRFFHNSSGLSQHINSAYREISPGAEPEGGPQFQYQYHPLLTGIHSIIFFLYSNPFHEQAGHAILKGRIFHPGLHRHQHHQILTR